MSFILDNNISTMEKNDYEDAFFFPLSPAQEGLWYYDQLHPENPAYNISALIKVKGKLDVLILKKSFDTLIERHESLRTIFKIVNGKTAQIILPSLYLSIPVINFENLSEVDAALKFKTIKKNEILKPFNLESGPLIRLIVVRHDVEEFSLLFSMHHIISDGWSMQIFARELAVAYDSYFKDRPVKLKELLFQYADYTQWQRDWLKSDTFQNQLQFWKERLQDISKLNFPAKHEKDISICEAGIEFIELDKDLVSQLRTLSNNFKVSFFMVLLATLNLLLYWYTGKKDILVGTPVANRNAQETEEVIGCFVNQIVLRANFSIELKFSDFLEYIKSITLEAYLNQDAPFNKVVEAVKPLRSLDRNPLFQVNFTYYDMPKLNIELSDLQIEMQDADTIAPRFDLEINLWNEDNKVYGKFIYACEIFNRDLILQMITNFKNILKNILEGPHKQLMEVLPYTVKEENLTLNAKNKDNIEDYCFHQHLTNNIHKFRHLTALINGNERISYDQLNERANLLALHLKKKMVALGENVGIYMFPSVQLVISILAIWKVRAAYVPLDPSYPLERICWILNDASINICLAKKNLSTSLSKYVDEVVCIDELSEDVFEDKTILLEEPKLTDLAYTIYTSGSTGTPKGVMINHESLSNYLSHCVNEYTSEHGKGAVLHSSIGFDLTITSIFTPFLVGHSLEIFPDSNDIEQLSFLFQEEKRLDFLKLTPAHLKAVGLLVNDNNIRQFSGVLVVGGEILSWQEVRKWKKILPNLRIINEYGPTEATVGCTTYEIKDNENELILSVPVGQALANCNIYILNDDMIPVPNGVVGELYIGGKCVSLGYLNKPALTATKFVCDPFTSIPGSRLFKSGDLGRYLSDGNIEFLGRSDSQIKIRGFRIEPGEIESTLKSHPSIHDVIVLAKSDRLIAYVVCKVNSMSTEDALKKFLSNIVPDYMIPSTYIFLESFSYTVNGKIDKANLPSPQERSLTLNHNDMVPRNDDELLLLSIWQQILGINNFGINDNFFDLGGDSISALQVVSRANQNGLHISPKDILQKQTVAKLAEGINKLEAFLDSTSFITTDQFLLTPIQEWFFKRKLTNINHYNQAVVLSMNNEVDSGDITIILSELVKHHDALRLRFKKQNNKWFQSYGNVDSSFVFYNYDFSSVSSDLREYTVNKISGDLQNSLNIKDGPLVSAAFFKFGKVEQNRLVIIIHHLVIDGVSWRILLEDLDSAYRQLLRKEKISISQRTTSYQSWAEKLFSHAQSKFTKCHMGFWAELMRNQISKLPIDFEFDKSCNLAGSANIITIYFDPIQTKVLLRDISITCKMQIMDFLLTALLDVLSKWLDAQYILIDIEGHGREDLFVDVNISRTIGWFTTIYPVFFEVIPGDLLRTLIKVKEKLESIPNRGIDIGLLQHLTEDGDINSNIMNFPKSEVIFNYLGQTGNIFSEEESMFKVVQEPCGSYHCPETKRAYMIEINAIVVNGELQIDCCYNNKIHMASTIEKFALGYKNSLLSLIDIAERKDNQIYLSSRNNINEQEHSLTSAAFTIKPDIENRYEAYPLTEVQEAYWVGRNLTFELGNVSCHIYREVEFIDFDLAHFNAVLQIIIERHDMLRTIFLSDGRQKTLEIVPPYEVKLRDLSEYKVSEKNFELESIRTKMSHQVLPADKWPLFEIKASGINKKITRLHFSFDLLIIDGWSLQLISQELFSLYRDANVCLEKLDISFRDYVIAVDNLKKSKDYINSFNYWLNLLPDIHQAPALPLNKSPSTLINPKFSRRQYKIEKKIWDGLKKLAQDKNLTPSALLLSAYAEILHAWSKSKKFTINLTLYNRLQIHPQINKIAGDFTSLVLLPIDYSKNSNFEENSQSIQEKLWEVMTHSNVSGVTVLRELARQQKASNFSMPIVFTSALTMDIDDEGSFNILQGDLIYSITQTPQVWLDHQVFEQDGQLVLIWDSIDDLFPVGMLNDMFEAYTKFLLKLNQDAFSWIKNPLTIIPDYQLTLFKKINNTSDAITNDTLHMLFVKQALRNPEKLAIISYSRELTYQELLNRSSQLGANLRKMGAQRNKLVVIFMEKGWEQIVAVLGILFSGAAYVPICPDLPKDRCKNLFVNSESVLFVTQTWLKARLSEYIDCPENIICINSDPISSNAIIPSEINTSSDLAYVIYTSGSTGQPKGVMIEHGSVVNTIMDINQRFNVKEEDRILFISALNFDLSVYDIFGSLSAGATIIVPAKDVIRDPALLYDLLLKNEITIWNSVPALLEIFIDYIELDKDKDLRLLRLIMLSGDWIPKTLPVKAKKLKKTVKVISLGGATEASIWSIFYPIEVIEPFWKSIPYGKPLANQIFYVLDDSLEMCPIFTVGNLYIGGLGLARGYWKDEIKTQNSFIKHPHTADKLYKTGDIGRYLPSGDIEFLGRSDFQVKIRGFRVELEEIESILQNFPSVDKALALMVNIKGSTPDLVICYTTDNKQQLSNHVLHDFLEEKLPQYMIPKHYIWLESLPLTPIGKVDRKQVEEITKRYPYNHKLTLTKLNIEEEVELVAEKFACLISEVIKIEQVDINANLLEIGANSIDIIRIVNKLGDKFNFRPTFKDFYSSPTIIELSKMYVRSLGKEHIDIKVENKLKSIWNANNIILTPEEKEFFKSQRLWLRASDQKETYINLESLEFEKNLNKLAILRKSHRKYIEGPISFANISKLLGSTYSYSLDGNDKRIYPSAGSLYPIQIFLHLKPNSVENLSGGTYYYHPIDHKLVFLKQNAVLTSDAYDPFINRPVFERAKISIFLFAKKSSISPVYGELSRDFCLLEAGYISQLLMMTASTCSIGLCPIGSLDFDRIKALFELDEDYELVHSLIGGLVKNNKNQRLDRPIKVEIEEGII